MLSQRTAQVSLVYPLVLQSSHILCNPRITFRHVHLFFLIWFFFFCSVCADTLQSEKMITLFTAHTFNIGSELTQCFIPYSSLSTLMSSSLYAREKANAAEFEFSPSPVIAPLSNKLAASFLLNAVNLIL